MNNETEEVKRYEAHELPERCPECDSSEYISSGPQFYVCRNCFLCQECDRQSAEVERLSNERDDVLDILWRDIDDLRDPKLTVVQVAAKAAKGRDKEIAAWQDAIYKVCVKAAVKAGFPDYTIDGGGSDGDELTFTLAEIEQAINCVQEAAESKLSQLLAACEKFLKQTTGKSPEEIVAILNGGQQ